MFNDLYNRGNPIRNITHHNLQRQAYENPTTIYKINLDSEVFCVKKLSYHDSIDKIREQLKADIHVNFLFCMKDKTKIMKSDEIDFQLSEIAYEEEEMKYINIISIQDDSSKNALSAPKQISKYFVQNPDPNVNNINPLIKISPDLNFDFAAPIPAENKSSFKHNPDSLLGKKLKPIETNIKNDSKKLKIDSEFVRDSSSSNNFVDKDKFDE